MIVMEVMRRQSETIVKTDRAAIIQILLKIKKAYPNFESPLQIQGVSEMRG
jgi:hypothetical protein